MESKWWSMMKILIVLVVGLLSVGCATLTPEEKALRDSVVGEYERKDESGATIQYVFLENGVWEWYAFGKKQGVIPKNSIVKWSIVDGEVHVEYGSGVIAVWRINPDKSITLITNIRDGKRTDLPKEEQHTYKKIK